jgi:hypothetical protein
MQIRKPLSTLQVALVEIGRPAPPRSGHAVVDAVVLDLVLDG